MESAVIGPRQLEERLDELAGRPTITVWEVGRSYQGRTGYAVDVHLPPATGQTHTSRLKLALQKPTCFIIGRHHANEVSSTTAALDMMDELSTDPVMRQWLERLNLVFLPMANPDGAATHYRLMAEHPRWKHHAARFNAAGMEFSVDTFNPDTAFGEAHVSGARRGCAGFQMLWWTITGYPPTSGASPLPVTILHRAFQSRTMSYRP